MQGINKKLYDRLIQSQRVTPKEIGDFDTFNKMLQDPENGEKLYNNLRKGDLFTEKEIGNQETFFNLIEKPKTQPTVSPQATVQDTTQPFINVDAQMHKDFGQPKVQPQQDELGIAPKLDYLNNKIQQREAEQGFFKRAFDTKDEEIESLASNLYERSQRHMNAVKGEGGTGVGDVLSDRNFWTLGASDLSTMFHLRRIANKMDRDEPLKENEKLLLDAWATNEEVNQMYPLQDAKRGYQVGRQVTEMVPWLVQFAATRGAGDAAVKGIEGALRKGAQKYLGKTLGKVASRAVAEVGGAYGASALMPQTYGDIIGRSLGDTQRGPDGNVSFNKATADKPLEAIYKGWTNNMLEVLTERLGDILVDSKIIPKVNLADKIKGETGKKAAQLFNDFTKAVGWNGAPVEFLEEWINVPLNALLVGDSKFSDMFDLDQQFTTFLTVVAMGSAMGVGQTSLMKGASAIDQQLTQRDYKSARNLYESEINEDLRKHIDQIVDNPDIDITQQSKQLHSLLSNLDDEKSGIILNYVVNKMKVEGAEMTAPEQAQQPVSPEQATPTPDPKQQIEALRMQARQEAENDVNSRLHTSGQFVTVQDREGNIFNVKDGDLNNGSGVLIVYDENGEPQTISSQDVDNWEPRDPNEVIEEFVQRFDNEIEQNVLQPQVGESINYQGVPHVIIEDLGNSFALIDQEQNVIEVPKDQLSEMNRQPETTEYFNDVNNIPVLAQKIANNEQLTDEDLQLQNNYPQELEAELQKLTQQPQPKQTVVNTATIGKTDYKYTVDEAGTFDIQIPEGLDPVKAEKEIRATLPKDQQNRIQVIKEEIETPPAVPWGTPTKESIVKMIRILPVSQQNVTGQPSQDNKKTETLSEEDKKVKALKKEISQLEQDFAAQRIRPEAIKPMTELLEQKRSELESLQKPETSEQKTGEKLTETGTIVKKPVEKFTETESQQPVKQETKKIQQPESLQKSEIDIETGEQKIQLHKKKIEYLEKMLPTIIKDMESGRDYKSSLYSIRSGILADEVDAYNQFFIDRGIIDENLNYIKQDELDKGNQEDVNTGVSGLEDQDGSSGSNIPGAERPVSSQDDSNTGEQRDTGEGVLSGGTVQSELEAKQRLNDLLKKKYTDKDFSGRLNESFFTDEMRKNIKDLLLPEDVEEGKQLVELAHKYNIGEQPQQSPVKDNLTTENKGEIDREKEPWETAFEKLLENSSKEDIEKAKTGLGFSAANFAKRFGKAGGAEYEAAYKTFFHGIKQAQAESEVNTNPTEAQKEIEPQIKQAIQAAGQQQELFTPLDKNLKEAEDRVNKKDKEKAEKPKEYKYHLTLRPFDIGTYPKDNFIRYEDDGTRYGVVVYSTPLPQKEIKHYELNPITEIENLDGKTVYSAEYPWTLELKKNERGYYYFEAVQYDEGQEVDRMNLTAEEVLRNISDGNYTFEKPEAKEKSEQPKQSDFGKSNKIFTEEAKNAALERLRKKRGELKSGIDPQEMMDAITVAGFHIEGGTRKFAEFAKNMINDAGEWIKPYLVSLYEAVRSWPGMQEVAKEMDSQQIVNNFDLDKNITNLADNQGKSETKDSEDRIINKQNKDQNGDEQKTTDDNQTDMDEGTSAEHTEGVLGERDAETDDNKQRGESQETGRNTKTEERETPAGRDRGDNSQRGSSGRGGLQNVEQKQSDTGETVSGDTERSSKLIPEQQNHIIEADDIIVPGGEISKIRTNIKSIKLAKSLEKNNKNATPEEKKILAQYVGWGGLAQVFKNEYWNESWKNKYGKFYNQLNDLLTPEELSAAKESTINAHYTDRSVIDAMWKMVEKMGFKGGRVIEPAGGIGHFFGLMPKNLQDNSQLRGVELDKISGLIFSKLYPQAKIDIKGFEQVNDPNNHYDLAITNVPFAGIHVHDSLNKDISKDFTLHNYFIAKSVRLLKPGGVGVFITTSSTMDNEGQGYKFRQWLHSNEGGNADLVDAIRLPNNAFKENAGTEVTTDILFIRKRDGETKHPLAKSFVVTGEYGEAMTKEVVGGYRNGRFQPSKESQKVTIRVNEFYLNNPDRMLGQMKLAHEVGAGGLYNPDQPTLHAPSSLNVTDELNKIADNFHENVFKEQKEVKDEIVYFAKDEQREGQLVTKDGKPYIIAFGILTDTGWNTNNVTGEDKKKYTKSQVVDKYNEVKEAVIDLVNAESNPDSNDEQVEQLRKELNKVYDNYVKTIGNINGNRKTYFLRADVDYSLVSSLEELDKVAKKDKSGNWYYEDAVKKADIFSQRTNKPRKQPDRADNLEDAIDISNAYRNGLDINYISQLLNRDKEAIQKELLDNELAYENPLTGIIEDRDTYLSGWVRKKLKHAEEAAQKDDKYNKNVEALRKVIPKDIPLIQIHAQIGASWIPNDVVSGWIDNLLEVKGTRAYHNKVTDQWSVRYPWEADHSIKNTNEHAAGKFEAKKLILDALNQRQPIAYDIFYDGDKKRQVNNEANTIAAQNKIGEFKVLFQDAIWDLKGENAERVARAYNDVYNAWVNKNITIPKNLKTFPGAVSEIDGKPIELRTHQKIAVKKALQGATMFAHQVGTGKTFSLITTAMEMKRLGIAKKPVIVVQSATTSQFVSWFRKLYPGAKLLVPDSKDLEASERKRLFAKIGLNEWDAVIIYHDFLTRIPDKPERQIAYIRERIAELEAVSADEEVPAFGKTDNQKEIEKLENEILEIQERDRKIQESLEDKGTVKNQAKRAVSQRSKLQRQFDRATDQVLYFEDMGIDALLVDEAHTFKRLGLATKGGNVKGIDTSGSQKSLSAKLKTRFILENNNNKNVVFATGTPISNTMAEAYTMMNYLIPDRLIEHGVNTFDDFRTTFGHIRPSLEFTAAGSFKSVDRFAEYINLPELQRLWQSAADVVLTEEIDELKAGVGTPVLKDNKYTQIHIKQTDALSNMMEGFREELKEWENLPGKEKRALRHVPLVIFNQAKRASVDVRLVDSRASDDPGSKVNIAVEKAFELYNESNKYKGTQLIFSDVIKSSDGRFNLYQEVKKKLIAKGVPEKEIQIISDHDTDAKREKLFDNVNNGKVRFLIGSTDKMGIGVNVQERLKAVHHLDAPSRPMDFEQRNGRLLRQDNLHLEMDLPVEVFLYGVEKTLDATAYQRLAIKQKFIRQMMKKGISSDRTLEDEDVDALGQTFDQMMANLSGSQYAIIHIKKSYDLRMAKMDKRNYERKQIDANDQINQNIYQNDRLQNAIEIAEKRIEYLKKNLPEREVTSLKISGGKEVKEDINKYLDDYSDEISGEANKLVFINGKIKGKIIFLKQYAKDPVTMRMSIEAGAGELFDLTSWNRYKTARGLFQKMFERIDELPGDIVRYKEHIAKNLSDNEKLQEIINQKYPKQNKLDELAKEVVELEAKMQEETSSKVKEIDKKIRDDDFSSIKEIADIPNLKLDYHLAQYLYNNKNGIANEQMDEDKFLSLENQNFIDEYGDLTEKGERFVDLVDKRKETRRRAKLGIDLFPGSTNIPEITGKEVDYVDVRFKGTTSTLLPDKLRSDRLKKYFNHLFSYAKNTGTIHVVESIDQVPERFKQRADELKGAQGFYVPGTGETYFVTGNIKNEAEAFKTWIHEVGVHRGLSNIIPSQEFNPMLEKLFEDLGKEEIQKNIPEAYHNKSKAEQAEEYLAYLGEKLSDKEDLTTREKGVWQKIIDAVKNILNKLFDGVKFTKQDAEDIVRAAVKSVYQAPVKGKETKTPVTQTKAFKDWFKDSKVVDKNGKPLVVYHGTRSKTEDQIKERSFRYNGFYTSAFPEYANYFAESGSVIPVYANIKNPLIIDMEDTNFGIRGGFIVDKRLFPSYRDLSKEEIDFLKQKGYDGIIVNVPAKITTTKWSEGDIYNSFEVVTFSPTQIKSATGNDGGFDPNNPDIRFRTSSQRPQRADFTTVGDYLNALEQYYKDNPDQSPQATRKANKVQNSILNNSGFIDKTIEAHKLASELYEEKNKEKVPLKETIGRMREFWLEEAMPLRTWQEEIIKRGGKLPKDVNAYRDLRNMFGRMEALYRKFQTENMDPIKETITKIVRGGMKSNGILPYMIAKHGLERNRVMREQKLKEWKVEFEQKNSREATMEEILDQSEKLSKKDFAGVTPLAAGKEVKDIDQLCENIIAGFEKQVDPKLVKELWDNIGKATTHTLDTWLKGGQLTEKQYNQYKNQYKNFIPLRGWKDDAAKYLRYKDNEGGIGASLKRALGRTSLADNPLAYIQSVNFKAINEQVKNEINQEAFKIVLNNYGDKFKDLHQIKRVYLVKEQIINEEGIKEEVWMPYTDDNGNLVRPPQELFDQGDVKTEINNEHFKLRKPQNAAQHEVYIQNNGKLTAIVFPGKNLPTAQVLNNQNTMAEFMGVVFDTRKLGDTWIFRGMAATTNFMKSMMTSYNPVFPLTNFFRDQPEAAITQFIRTNARMSDVAFKHSPQAAYSIVRDMSGKFDPNNKFDVELHNFYEAGGTTGFTHEKTIEKLEKELKNELKRSLRMSSVRGQTVDKLTHILKYIEHWNRMFEDTTRFAIYLGAREKGLSIKDAAFESRNASVDFNMKGKGTRIIEAGFAFFKAGINALQKNFQLAKNKPGKFTAVASIVVMMGLLEAMLNDWGDDDDEYYNLNDYVRENYFVVKKFWGDKDSYLRVPLPQFWRGFHAMGISLYDFFNNKISSGDVVAKTLSNMLAGMAPIDVTGFIYEGKLSSDPLWPTFIKPVREIVVNRNFMGSKIAYEAFTKALEEDLADSGLHKKNVNPAAKFLTDMLFRAAGGEGKLKFKITDDGQLKYVPNMLDVNPSKVEHLINGYLGGTGRFLNDGITSIWQWASSEEEIDWNNVPFYSSFIRNVPEEKWSIIRSYQKYQEYVKDADKYRSTAKGERNIDNIKKFYGSDYAKAGKILKAHDKMIDNVMENKGFDNEQASQQVIDLMKQAIERFDKLNIKK